MQNIEGYLGPEEFLQGAEALLELSLAITDLAWNGPPSTLAFTPAERSNMYS